MPCPIPSYIPNFKRIHPCLQNPEPIQMGIIFMLRISKESLNVQNPQQIQMRIIFMLKQPGSEQISKFFVYCKFSTKNFKKIWGEIFLNCWTLFSFSIVPYSILTYIPNFKRIPQCVQNPEQIQMCIIFMLKQPGSETFFSENENVCRIQSKYKCASFSCSNQE